MELVSRTMYDMNQHENEDLIKFDGKISFLHLFLIDLVSIGHINIGVVNNHHLLWINLKIIDVNVGHHHYV